jgi:hypothetical protein
MFLIEFERGTITRQAKNYFQQPKQNYLTLSSQSDTTAFFPTVRYTFCDTYISLPILESQFLKHGSEIPITGRRQHLIVEFWI